MTRRILASGPFAPIEGPSRVLPIVLAVTATSVSINSLILPSLSEIVAGVGASESQAGLVVAMATLPGIVLAPVMGLLSDRYGRREVIIPCLVVFGIAGGLAGSANSLGWLLGWRFLQGVGVSGLVNLAVALVGDHWEGTARATVLGRNVAMLTGGLSVYPLVGGALTQLFSWRAPFFLYPLALVTAVAVARTLPASTRRDIDLKDQLSALGPALRGPYVIRALLGTSVVFFIIFGIFLTVVPIYLADSFGVSPAARGVILAAPAVPNMVAALAAGHLPVSPRQSMAIGTMGLVGALVSLAATESLLLVLVGMLLFGAGEGLIMPNIHFITTGVDKASRGGVVALYTSAKGTGQTIGPPVGSAAYGSVGAQATMMAGVAICIFVLLPLLALPATAVADRRAGPAGDR